ncbi:hypothetical protein B0H16DRAFT_1801991 [Mycena metata]|uniref:Uncharacterized protein n=1 Tax=Mycena metata TaxID=1033252 RepID=A0AAD7HAK2_9AGAR|nr:hypothetical protein B0H16DRAFT_1801991 [Mycena metata]
MPTLTHIAVGAASLNLTNAQLFFACCGVGALLALPGVFYIVFPTSTWRLAIPARVHLSPAMSLPEFPFRPTSDPCPLKIIPKARILGGVQNVLRFGARTQHGPPQARAYKPAMAPVPQAVVLPTGTDTFSIGSGFIPILPQESSSWIDVIEPSFKYSLGHASLQSAEVKQATTDESKPIHGYTWGTVTHTLALPLRGTRTRGRLNPSKTYLFLLSPTLRLSDSFSPHLHAYLIRQSGHHVPSSFWVYGIIAASLLPPTLIIAAGFDFCLLGFLSVDDDERTRKGTRTDHPSARKPPPKRTENPKEKVDEGFDIDFMGTICGSASLIVKMPEMAEVGTLGSYDR